MVLNSSERVKHSMYKIPTQQEYKAYDGAHCHVLFRSVSKTWRCPSCNRTKFEIMRWIKRNNGMGWLCGLHTHHDHSEEPYIYHGNITLTTNIPRFPHTIICDQCNMVDATIKRRYSDIPRNFSFSPSELQQIIFARPHQPHVVKYLTAYRIYERVTTNVS